MVRGKCLFSGLIIQCFFNGMLLIGLGTHDEYAEESEQDYHVSSLLPKSSLLSYPDAHPHDAPGQPAACHNVQKAERVFASQQFLHLPECFVPHGR